MEPMPSKVRVMPVSTETCRHCHAALPRGVRYCPYCRWELNSAPLRVVVPDVEPPVPEPVAPPPEPVAPPPEPVAPPPEQPAPQPPPIVPPLTPPQPVPPQPVPPHLPGDRHTPVIGSEPDPPILVFPPAQPARPGALSRLKVWHILTVSVIVSLALIAGKKLFTGAAAAHVETTAHAGRWSVVDVSALPVGKIVTVSGDHPFRIRSQGRLPILVGVNGVDLAVLAAGHIEVKSAWSGDVAVRIEAER